MTAESSQAPAGDRYALAFAACVFLAYQLWLSLAVWSGGPIPPFFDDSYAYILGIRRFAEGGRLLPDVPYPPRWGQFLHLAYNQLMGSVSLVLGLTPERVYFLSFILGKVVLLATILRFLEALESDTLVRASALLAASFYSGGLGFHGFYWVVPDFWMLCVLLWLLAEVTAPSSGCLAAACAGVLLAGLHPLGAPFYLLLVGYGVVLSWLGPNEDRLRRLSTCVVVGIAVLIVTQLPVMFLSSTTDADDAFRSAWAVGYASQGQALPGLSGFRESYLDVITRPPVLPLLLASLALLAVQRRWPLLVLFVVALGFSLGSTLHRDGYRSLILLWPLTILVLGCAPALTWRRLAPRVRAGWPRRLLAVALTAGLLAFVASWSVWTRRVIISAAREYSGLSWDKGCAELALTRTGDRRPLYYGSKYASLAFLSAGTYRRIAMDLDNLKLDLERASPGEILWAVLDGDWQHEPRWAPRQRMMRTDILNDPRLGVLSHDCGAFELLEVRRLP